MVKYLSIILCVLIVSALKAQDFNIEKSGDILSVALPVSAFASTIIWQDKQEPNLQFIKTMGLSLVITHSIKRIINKERPNGGDYSFPSGHTSAAFTGAAFIERKYGFKYGIPSYLLASYVGWTRIHENKHDKWDVLGGAIIGIGSAYIFTKSFKNTELSIGYLEKKPTLNLTIRI
jgi:hypothetical protein